MYKVQVITDDPDRLLHLVSKKQLVEEDILISLIGSDMVEHTQREEVHPIKDFFWAVSKLIGRTVLIATALLSLAIIGTTWLLGLVQLFGQFGMQGVQVVAGALITLLISYLFYSHHQRLALQNAAAASQEPYRDRQYEVNQASWQA